MARTLYKTEISHGPLGKHRVITGASPEIVEAKAKAQLREWEHRYAIEQARSQAAAAKLAAANVAKQARIDAKQELEADIAEAASRTRAAEDAIAELRGILSATLDVDDAIDWDSLRDRTECAEPPPAPPVLLPVPREPREDDPAYAPKFGILSKLIPAWRRKKALDARVLLEVTRRFWCEEWDEIQSRNGENERQYQSRLAEYNEALRKHQNAREVTNASVAELEARYYAKDEDAIREVCDLVLSRSAYPECFPKEWSLEYRGATKSMVIDYMLPALEALPHIKEVRHVRGRSELKEVPLSVAERNALYDEVIYQVCLRTIHEVFESDKVGAIDAVAFNGIVTSLDKSSGHSTTACILTVHVRKEEFLRINLAQIDPKACFRSLKGVGSSKLHSITPVAPILTISHEDPRFVEARCIGESVGAESNLAAMDWEDFEHLIREVFEAEFSSSGGVVKVTQASRDGGVDVIAFDPDPIRGGKIVIQAKRYTNTVGVSAVRDLYGTLMNEGATKGILVTTSDFGPDAYDFAKDKPLSLLGGGSLLSLLAKHGRRATIDLKAAKAFLGDADSRRQR